MFFDVLSLRAAQSAGGDGQRKQKPSLPLREGGVVRGLFFSPWLWQRTDSSVFPLTQEGSILVNGCGAQLRFLPIPKRSRPLQQSADRLMKSSTQAAGGRWILRTKARVRLTCDRSFFFEASASRAMRAPRPQLATRPASSGLRFAGDFDVF